MPSKRGSYTKLRQLIIDGFPTDHTKDGLGPYELASMIWDKNQSDQSDYDFEEILAVIWGMSNSGLFEMDSRLRLHLPETVQKIPGKSKTKKSADKIPDLTCGAGI